TGELVAEAEGVFDGAVTLPDDGDEIAVSFQS
ncbi:MAG: hypothetical protein J07HB67_01944, partial [halophilic archaeon J07HB67]